MLERTSASRNLGETFFLFAMRLALRMERSKRSRKKACLLGMKRLASWGLCDGCDAEVTECEGLVG